MLWRNGVGGWWAMPAPLWKRPHLFQHFPLMQVSVEKKRGDILMPPLSFCTSEKGCGVVEVRTASSWSRSLPSHPTTALLCMNASRQKGRGDIKTSPLSFHILQRGCGGMWSPTCFQVWGSTDWKRLGTSCLEYATALSEHARTCRSNTGIPWQTNTGKSILSYQSCPYSSSWHGEQGSVLIVTISPKADWVWTKQSFLFSFMFCMRQKNL